MLMFQLPMGDWASP